MKKLTREQRTFAIAALDRIMTSRGLNQSQLAQLTGVSQGTICKILKDQQEPTDEQLSRLYEPLGIKLNDVLHEAELVPDRITGYLATPLTDLTGQEEQCLDKVVASIRTLAATTEFSDRPFNIYWPGDVTHPRRHTNFTDKQVYKIDRSRASGLDFVILFCGSGSYGVGQENEIAAQAGLPAIRLLPTKISRMITGSFLMALDIMYEGGLNISVTFNEDDLLEALRNLRRSYFSHQARFKNINGNGFGLRLRKLLNERHGDYQKFADELGVSLHYIHALMDEPFSISNPSAKLLRRMGLLLDVSVGHLLGEIPDVNPQIIESRASWRSWIQKNPGHVDASLALQIKDEWEETIAESARPSADSFRPSLPLRMQESDWQRLYNQRSKGKISVAQGKLL